MKKLSILLIALFLLSCNSNNEIALVQVSTIDALLSGYYDGVEPIGRIKGYGNLGLGTFDKLDGEMIVLDGIVYQIRDDGKIYLPDANVLSPFFTVVNFSNDLDLKIKTIENYSTLESELDSLLENKNLFYAFKASGKFNYVKTRSVPAQTKPYKPLSEVTKHQSFFERNNAEGTLIGFRVPQYASGINVPGYHFHFISSDKKFGGHVLDVSFDKLTIESQKIDRFKMILPNDSEFGSIDFMKDRNIELKRVER